MKLFNFLKKDNCKDCDYYIKENGTCQSRKCATCGTSPYVTKLDRLFCTPVKMEKPI